MGIRTIRSGGSIIAYQALAGAGGKGKSAYFGVSTHGAEKALSMAAAAALSMRETPPVRPAQLGNAGGIPGLQLVYYPSRREGDSPILYAQATWSRGGVSHSHKYSTQKHGNVPAVELAMAAREKGSGQACGMTAIEAYAAMMELL